MRLIERERLDKGSLAVVREKQNCCTNYNNILMPRAKVFATDGLYLHTEPGPKAVLLIIPAEDDASS